MKSTETQGVDSTKYSSFFESGTQYLSPAQGLSLFVKSAPGQMLSQNQDADIDTDDYVDKCTSTLS